MGGKTMFDPDAFDDIPAKRFHRMMYKIDYIVLVFIFIAAALLVLLIYLAVSNEPKTIIKTIYEPVSTDCIITKYELTDPVSRDLAMLQIIRAHN